MLYIVVKLVFIIVVVVIIDYKFDSSNLVMLECFGMSIGICGIPEGMHTHKLKIHNIGIAVSVET